MKAWDDFLISLAQDLGQETVDRWLKSLKVVHFDAGNLYLEAKDAFQAAWFEEHIRAKARKSLLNNNSRPVKVHLSFIEAARKPKKNSVWKPVLNLSADALDPKSTFETFLGEKNRDLFREALESRSFNPIYLHGPSGSGKTHLLMAAAHFLKEKQFSCFYVRAETLTEHVVAAIRTGAMQKFREIYRNHDVLLIDDIDVIAGRSATQEEFFHTFNTLHAAGRQIILSAKVPPARLSGIEPRLTSRFEWGLVFPLQKLDGPELQNLLNLRMQEAEFPLGSGVREFLTAQFFSPKSLLRALDALMLRAHLDHLDPEKITASQAASIASKLLEEEKKALLTPEKIVRAVAAGYGIKASDIFGKSQTQQCALPRQIAMYLCRTHLKMSFMKIAAQFCRDHSTVMSSIKSVEKKLESLKPELTEITQKLHTETT
jgi:chromosomal replication initiator protein